MLIKVCEGTFAPFIDPALLLVSARLVGGVEAGTRSEELSSSNASAEATWIVDGADESTDGARLIVVAAH
jgi:hypothetical protein